MINGGPTLSSDRKALRCSRSVSSLPIAPPTIPTARSSCEARDSTPAPLGSRYRNIACPAGRGSVNLLQHLCFHGSSPQAAGPQMQNGSATAARSSLPAVPSAAARGGPRVPPGPSHCRCDQTRLHSSQLRGEGQQVGSTTSGLSSKVMRTATTGVSSGTVTPSLCSAAAASARSMPATAAATDMVRVTAAASQQAGLCGWVWGRCGRWAPIHAGPSQLLWGAR